MKKILLLLAAVAGIFTGCVPPELTLRHFPENPSAPLTVAALLPLTGENRIYAEQMLEGLLAAESRINNQNGINGRRVKLLAIDTKGSASGSSEALQKAASAGAVAAIAGYGHREVEMLTAHAAKLQMPMVLPVATGDSLTEISPFIYRSCFSDSQQMEVLASYLFHWRQLTRGAIITDSGNNAEYSLNIARHFTQAVKNNDCTIAVNCVIPQGSGLTGRQLANLLAHDPQFILIAASGRRAAEIFGKVREGGFSGVLCGPESCIMISLLLFSDHGAKASFPGIRFSPPFSAKRTTPGSSKDSAMNSAGDFTISPEPAKRKVTMLSASLP